MNYLIEVKNHRFGTVDKIEVAATDEVDAQDTAKLHRITETISNIIKSNDKELMKLSIADIKKDFIAHVIEYR